MGVGASVATTGVAAGVGVAVGSGSGVVAGSGATVGVGEGVWRRRCRAGSTWTDRLSEVTADVEIIGDLTPARTYLLASSREIRFRVSLWSPVAAFVGRRNRARTLPSPSVQIRRRDCLARS